MDGPPQDQWFHPGYDIYRPGSYPSPAPSDPSPAPRAHQQLMEPFPQMDSSIGPSRVMRRKQGSAIRRASFSYPDVASDRYADSRPALHMSPHLSYRPNTPSSMTSPYSPYDCAQRRSRTRSTSTLDHTQHPRAPSPALSSASARTFSSHGNSNGMDSSMDADTHKSGSGPGPIREKMKHTKHRLRDADRKKICLFHISHPNARQEDIGMEFGVERSTISKILKDKDKWLNISLEDEANEQTAKHRPSKFPEVEATMLRSLQNWSDTGTNITDHLIRQRALEIAKSFHISTDRFKGSSGWIENFKHRHDIRRGEWLRAERRTVQNTSFNLTVPPSQAQEQAVPETPVIMAYDQAGATTGESSASQESSQQPAVVHAHSHSQEQITPQQHWPQHQHHQAHSGLVLDPALQDPSSSILHHPHTAILHSPQTLTYSDYSHTTPVSTSAYPLHHTPHPGGVLNPEAPTLQEAEDALNVVITYVDTCGREILKGNERETLTHIKCALFQFASGITYDR